MEHKAVGETACIFDIQRMSLHDGPGIRTNIFFKGCNLRCFWCHNPESWERQPQLQFFEGKCIGCGACVPACPLNLHTICEKEHHFRREDCTGCGACAAACPSGCLVLTGCRMTVEEISAQAERDIPFFNRSGGGVTLTGGEPLLQPDSAVALLERLRECGIHTAVETALHIERDVLAAILPHTCLVLADLKLADPVLHREATGAGNERILENLLWLDRVGAPYCVRIPVIPGVNDSREVMGGISEFTAGLLNPQYIEFMPYHAMGEAKYASLGLVGKTQGCAPPGKERLRELAGLFGKGVPVRC